jgi:hypothetical protein
MDKSTKKKLIGSLISILVALAGILTSVQMKWFDSQPEKKQEEKLPEPPKSDGGNSIQVQTNGGKATIVNGDVNASNGSVNIGN